MKTQIKGDAEVVVNLIKPYTFDKIWTFGNGGSAAIADHMVTDWMKFANVGLRVISLSSNGPLLSAIGNDLGYQHTADKQMEWLVNPCVDCVVLISSSGTSPNIVLAAEKCIEMDVSWVAFVGNAKGSQGGRLKELAPLSVYCDSEDYGEIEDYHSNVMHEVARQLKALK